MLRLLLVTFVLLLVLLVSIFAFFFFVLEPADRTLLFSRKETIKTSDVERTYRIIGNYNQGKNKPLLIGLHGFRDRSLWLGAYSGVHLLADQEDILVALPDGRRQSWNGVFCCGWSYLNKSDDVSFIMDMIEDIKSKHAVDESRIYIFGFSNGGLMAQRMLHERPDTFAAAASFMSGVGDNDQTLDISNAKTPLLLVNGTEDIYVPIEEPRSIPGFNFIPAHQTADIWASQLGIYGKSGSIRQNYTEYTWNDENGAESPQLILRIYDARHRWPQWRFPDFPQSIPEPTKDMWSFLRQHSL